MFFSDTSSYLKLHVCSIRFFAIILRFFLFCFFLIWYVDYFFAMFFVSGLFMVKLVLSKNQWKTTKELLKTNTNYFLNTSKFSLFFSLWDLKTGF